MEFLGVDPMELILILIIAIIILGPNDMVKTGRTIGRTMRRVVKSPLWAAMLQTSHNIRTLPNRLMREAGLEEDIKDLKQTQEELRRQVAEVQKIRSPLMAGVKELDDEVRSISDSVKEVDDEVRSVGGSLSAWTTTQPLEEPPAVPATETGNSDSLSAWITPVSPSNPISPENSPVQIYEVPAPDENQTDETPPSIETTYTEY